jgi:hypothetical protein
MEAELSSMKVEVNGMKDLLAGIPSKVSEVERSLQSLERFVGVPSLSLRREMHDVMAKAPMPLARIFDAFEKVEDDARYTGLFTLSVKEEQALATVIIEFPAQSETIEFTYAPDWNIVLAEAMVAQDLLLNLLDENDSGETMPPMVVAGKPSQTEVPSFKATLKRPFKWTQSLAGLDLSSSSVGAFDVMNRIMERLTANRTGSNKS